MNGMQEIPQEKYNLFTGLLICADCGGKLSYREPAEHKEKKYDSDYSFVCQH